MDRYHVYSTADMVDWTDHGEILSSSDVPWGREEGGFMWAPDCAYKDGKYYFYFPHPSGADWNNTWKIGVAVSDSPASGFEVRGYFAGIDSFAMIDPAVFVDDDGAAYFYYGGGSRCKGGRLKESMTELDGALLDMSGLEDFHEAAWVFKRDGIYYMVYADNFPGRNRLRYATSSSPLGPWTYRGILLDPVSSDTSHGSVVVYRGQWYLFYHTCDISGMGNLRSICFDKLYFEADGSIVKVIPTTGLAASLRRAPVDAGWTDRAVITAGSHSTPRENSALWYRSPARVWEEALPLGNGKLGAMVFGGVSDERIQLNEHSLWDGYALNPNNPEGAVNLSEVQRLLFENKNNEAVELASLTMMGRPKSVKSYQSLGELWFDTPETSASNYIRSLSLTDAVASTTYMSGGVTYTREHFASSPDNIIVVRITASEKGKVSLSLGLTREKDASVSPVPSDPHALMLSGRIDVKDATGAPRGTSFASVVKAIAEGGLVTVTTDSFSHRPRLTVESADALTLLISGATDYTELAVIAAARATGAAPSAIVTLPPDPVAQCLETISRASARTFDDLKAAHIADYKQYYDRVTLSLAPAKTPETVDIPTDERLRNARAAGAPDLHLVEDYFNYGRYLLISSSRPGGMPANLQGLWAWQMDAPWNADYHTNINFQMNYWPAEVTGLSEMHMPLFDLTDLMIEPGGRTAEAVYGARGWVVHHLTDAWGYTAPADGPQGIWPMGAAWLSQHYWEHYQFTGDRDFLSQRAWPAMKGAARFLIDFLVEAPSGTAYAGKLVTNPSYSPENAFYLPDGRQSVFTYGATMDLEIIYDLLTNCVEASKVLSVDKAFRAECEETLSRLPSIKISDKTGRIMEWAEDYREVEPNHRHTSHLFGLHPGNQITVTGTPQLAEAARKTLIARGDDGTGWGLAWKINMWSRLHDGDHAYKLLSVLLSEKTLPNLFDDHPPFQIDGNFGATAAIAEMFVQSNYRAHDKSYEIHILPSLPRALSSQGSVKGLKTRGGFTVDISWKDNTLSEATVYVPKPSTLHIRTGDKSVKYKTKAAQSIKITPTTTKITSDLKK
jgi:alpha-L-fucosidase 2